MDNSPMNTREKGRYGEDEAMEYLISQGYTVLFRNFQTKTGEIDCVASDAGGTIAFIEVKAGNNSKFGHPLFWVTRAKQKQIVLMARRYLREHNLTNKPCRFDVISICNGKLEHLKNAFLLGY
jgi:putative endonuclease